MSLPFEDEVLPPPLPFLVEKNAHKGPPYLGKIENPRASRRPASANFCRSDYNFCAGIGQPPQGFVYLFFLGR